MFLQILDVRRALVRSKPHPKFICYAILKKEAMLSFEIGWPCLVFVCLCVCVCVCLSVCLFSCTDRATLRGLPGPARVLKDVVLYMQGTKIQ